MPNQLFYGDNLDVLRKYLHDETVDLCYIDPPFNSKRNYFQIYTNVGKEDLAQTQAFIDTWTWNERARFGYQEIIGNGTGHYTRQTIELITGLRAVLGEGSLLAYLVSMIQRVNEIWRVLKSTGSFYLHCDPTASHYLKLVLDGIFCARGGEFRNELIWQRTATHNDAKQGAKQFGRVHDVVLFYVKSSKLWTFNTLYQPYSEQYLDASYNKTDKNKRRFKTTDLSAAKPGGNTSYFWNGISPPKGRYWAFSYENMQKFDAEGKIYYSKSGRPYLKQYLDEMPGKTPNDIWLDFPGVTTKSERLGYPTQKPEALLERIIQASSNEDDVVLDAYCGCGTTVAVSQRLRRNWIGIDITYQSIAVILKRLEDSFGAAIIDAVHTTGIPRDVAAVQALANKNDDRLRKEFEKWAVLTYSRNRAVINDKKGADRGIDGTAYIFTGADSTARVIFQVKSGKVKRNDIATLNSDRIREHAELAILITLESPTKPMLEEAVAAGFYHHLLSNRNVARIQIVTIQDMLETNKHIDLPLQSEVFKSAKSVSTAEQKNFGLE